MSQDLFEINRNNLKKIFEAHQNRGTILFTDILKICTATRIFPNLLTSKDLRKLIIQVTNVASGDELSAKLSYEEMEEFLRGVAKHSYPSRRGMLEQFHMLFLHMRNPCYLRYNIMLEIEDKSKKQPEAIKPQTKPSLGLFFRPSSEHNLLSCSPYRSRMVQKKTSNLNALISPKINNTFGFSLKLHDESSRDSSAQPSPKARHSERTSKGPENTKIIDETGQKEDVVSQIAEIFNNFKDKTQAVLGGNRGVTKKDLGILMDTRRRQTEKQMKLKLCFSLWKGSSR